MAGRRAAARCSEKSVSNSLSCKQNANALSALLRDAVTMITGAVSALHARSLSVSTSRSSSSPRTRSTPIASSSPRASALVSSEARALPSSPRARAYSRGSRPSVVVYAFAASAAAPDEMNDAVPIKTTARLSPDARRVVLLCAVTMLLASADRTIFSLGSLAIARDLSLSMSTVGLLQSAFFWGYGVTQILGGVAADRFGGAKVLLAGLGLWSVGVAMIPAATLTPTPVAVIVAARVLFGAASGCMMPASAAAVALSVPAERRSSSLSLIFTFFNCGSAFGLLLAGSLIQTVGWKAVFLAFGAVGVAWSAIGLATVPESAKKGKVRQSSSRGSEREGDDGRPGGWLSLPGWMYPQLGALAWCHVCINWGFFILQSWLPVYLAKELGFSLGGSGLASALPWFLTAACSFSSGQIADILVARGWERWKVRRLMMNIATIGPATALMLLPAARSPVVAVFLLAMMLGTQAVSIAGYHSYVQDVLPSRAGSFLGMTNTLGVIAGIVANLFVGYVVETTGGFRLVFLVTALVYASSGVVWNLSARGRVMFA